MIVQAMVESLSVLTADDAFTPYDVAIVRPY
jgi:hypothetical protein